MGALPEERLQQHHAKDKDAAAWELHHAGAPIDDIDVAALPALLHLSTATPHPYTAFVYPKPAGSCRQPLATLMFPAWCRRSIDD